MFYLGWMAILLMNIRRDHRAVWLCDTTFGAASDPLLSASLLNLRHYPAALLPFFAWACVRWHTDNPGHRRCNAGSAVCLRMRNVKFTVLHDPQI
jgi:hypothetical protein